MGGAWSLFFVLTTLMVVPSLVMLWMLRDKLETAQGHVTRQAGEQALAKST